MNVTIKAAAKYLILLFITVLLLYVTFKNVSIKAVIQHLIQAKLVWVLLSVAASFFALLVRTTRWQRLITATNYKTEFGDTFYSLMIGYFANLALPRLGEVSRCSALYKRSQVPFNILLGTVVLERIIDVLSLAACIIIVLLIEFDRIGQFFIHTIFQPVYTSFIHFISSPLKLMLAIAGICIISILAWLYFKNKRKSGNGKMAVLIKGFVDGLRSIRSVSNIWLFVGESVLIWVLYFLSVYVCLFALPATGVLGMNAALFLLVAGGIGMSAPVQGGIGAYHLLVSQGLVLYGLSLEDGLAFATLIHSLQLILIITLGSLSLFLLFRKGKRSEPVKKPVVLAKDPILL